MTAAVAAGAYLTPANARRPARGGSGNLPRPGIFGEGDNAICPSAVSIGARRYGE
jgi:hypothetical protein